MILHVDTPLLRWLGIASVVGGIGTALVVTGGAVGVVLTLILTNSVGIALVLMAARIEASELGIRVHRLTSSHEIAWDSVVGASIGGGNFVLYFSEGRISMPSPEFWAGRQRQALSNLIADRLGHRGVIIQRTARAAVHVDARSPNKSRERTRDE